MRPWRGRVSGKGLPPLPQTASPPVCSDCVCNDVSESVHTSFGSVLYKQGHGLKPAPSVFTLRISETSQDSPLRQRVRNPSG